MMPGFRRAETYPQPLRVKDTIGMWSQPVTLTLGHPLRGNTCLFCDNLIGGQECRFALLIVADLADCDCGQVPTVTQLVCASHGTPTASEIARAVLRYSVRAHPNGAHTCRG